MFNKKFDRVIEVSVVVLLIVVVSIIGLSYSYFTTSISGNDEASSMILTTKPLSVSWNATPDSSETGLSSCTESIPACSESTDSGNTGEFCTATAWNKKEQTCQMNYEFEESTVRTMSCTAVSVPDTCSSSNENQEYISECTRRKNCYKVVHSCSCTCYYGSSSSPSSASLTGNYSTCDVGCATEHPSDFLSSQGKCTATNSYLDNQTSCTGEYQENYTYYLANTKTCKAKYSLTTGTTASTTTDCSSSVVATPNCTDSNVGTTFVTVCTPTEFTKSTHTCTLN